MPTFREMIKAVQENNKINGAKWSDWEDVFHLEDVYDCVEEDDFKQVSREFLRALIRDDGYNLQLYLDTWSALQTGQVFV